MCETKLRQLLEIKLGDANFQPGIHRIVANKFKANCFFVEFDSVERAGQARVNLDGFYM